MAIQVSAASLCFLAPSAEMPTQALVTSLSISDLSALTCSALATPTHTHMHTAAHKHISPSPICRPICTYIHACPSMCNSAYSSLCVHMCPAHVLTPVPRDKLGKELSRFLLLLSMWCGQCLLVRLTFLMTLTQDGERTGLQGPASPPAI